MRALRLPGHADELSKMVLPTLQGAKRIERSDEVSWNEPTSLIVPAKTQSEPVAEAVDRKMQLSNPPATKRTSQYFRAPQSTLYVAP